MGKLGWDLQPHTPIQPAQHRKRIRHQHVTCTRLYTTEDDDDDDLSDEADSHDDLHDVQITMMCRFSLDSDNTTMVEQDSH